MTCYALAEAPPPEVLGPADVRKPAVTVAFPAPDAGDEGDDSEVAGDDAGGVRAAERGQGRLPHAGFHPAADVGGPD